MTFSFREVRRPGDNKLLFRYDPERDIVEIVQRRVRTVVDLRQYRSAQESWEALDYGRVQIGDY